MHLENELQKLQLTSFRPGQKEIIESVLGRVHTIGVLPTGSGKTLCYQLPTRMMLGLTLVVSPLLSLMEDQVIQLRLAGEKRVAHLSGLLSYNEKKAILSQVNNLSMLFVSPEMLASGELLQKLQHCDVSLVVIDEAHCISQWGHEFRTEYLRLPTYINKLGSPTVLALTATATKNVIDDIRAKLDLDNAKLIQHSVNRPNIFLRSHIIESEQQRQQVLLGELEHCQLPAIVYVSTRKDAQKVSELLQANEFYTAYYHAGLSREDRSLVQSQFLDGDLQILVATTAFGMGVNKRDIRTVIHLHLPQSVESYVQEIGRAGRDSLQSEAIAIISTEDKQLPLTMIDYELPTEEWLLGFARACHGLSFEEAKHASQLEETMWRMLAYYFNKQGLIINQQFQTVGKEDKIRDLAQHFLKRRLFKQRQLYQVEELMTSSTCTRKQIIEFFGESTFEKPAFCCDRCQQTRPLMDQPITRRKRDEVNWQTRLHKLLYPVKDTPSCKSNLK
ncbi:ATP-dependent DNA helicase RecQ [Paenalkalicoccus suaedae]|uniref:ATP-dependent DNA helicase RecQ n=1 Tax=Paenalkalicoccus suaedae TaxID=2592382 RepID=A0A859FCV1_9BACI|nr:RecQ family ATP-dependent DNA helicase [Paenalkalicoccus suaedae]QKS71059.1 ATP-dependent DNA helicase RecQ [Paenalkalicoccus suaedae]